MWVKNNKKGKGKSQEENEERGGGGRECFVSEDLEELNKKIRVNGDTYVGTIEMSEVKTATF